MILHDTNFTTEEFKQIGKSTFHLKTELFYKAYGIKKAIRYYQSSLNKLISENPDTFEEIELWHDYVTVLRKLDLMNNQENPNYLLTVK